jgi:hypothetical protein
LYEQGVAKWAVGARFKKAARLLSIKNFFMLHSEKYIARVAA